MQSCADVHTPVIRPRIGFSYRHRGDGKLQGGDRGSSFRGPGAHAGAGRAARRRAAQDRLLADPQPARLGPRPHRQFRGVWLVRNIGARSRCTAGWGASTTRSRTPARPAASCRSCATRSYVPSSRMSACALWTYWSGWTSAPRPRTRCCGTVSSTRCCSPTSCSTTRRCCSCCSWSTATSSRPRSRPNAIPWFLFRSPRSERNHATGPRGRRWSLLRPASTRSALLERGFAYDNERPRQGGRAPRLRDRSRARDQRGLCRFRRGDRRRTAAVLGARREGWVSARGAGARRSTRHPVIMSPGRTPTPSPAGPAAAAERARVGGRPRAPRRRRPRPGNGPAPISWPTQASRRSPIAEYSEPFFGDAYRVLRGGSWVTHRVVARRLPQLGPAAAPPDLRRAALREGRMIAIEVHLDAEAAATMARDIRPGLVPTRRRWRRSTSTTSAARGCSSKSPSSPSTTRPGRAGDPQRRSARSSTRRAAPAPWSSWAPARRRRPATC